MTVIFNMSLITAIRLLCFLPYFVTSAVGDASSYCERPWPSIELFLPYKLGTNNRDGRLFEFESLFLRSFLMFWPHKISNVSLNVGIDVEKKTSKRAVELGATIQSLNISGGAKVSLLPSSVYYRTGYDRQQYVMMWADNFTNKEYIGFVDSDAVFLTYVDREDLFEDGKPVVNARSGYHMTHKDGVHLWSVGSYETLGFLEPFKCMSYFPVIVKREHLKDMRDFISQRHNLSFDDVFYQNISSPATTHPRDYSQFAIMCSYLYQFKRDEYKWYVHSETPGWDGLNPPPPYGQDGNISQFTPEMNLPKPRITTHGRYRRTKTNGMTNIHNRIEMNALLLRGYCLSPPFPKTEAICQNSERKSLKLGYYAEMHHFDLIDYESINNVSSLKHQYEKRFQRIKNCTHAWNVEEIDNISKRG